MIKRYFEQPGKFLPAYDKLEIYEHLYKLNSEGYRTLEFDQINWSESVVLFGCSNVFGTGLTEDETLAYKLEQMSGWPVVNMGQPGAALAYCLFNQMVLREMPVRPRAVVNIWTAVERFTFFDADKTISTAHRNTMFKTEDLKNLYLGWTGNVHNPAGYAHMTQRLCRILWADTVHVEASWFNYTSEVLDVPFLRRIDSARDGGHPGVRSVHDAAKIIHYLLRSKIQ